MNGDGPIEELLRLMPPHAGAGAVRAAELGGPDAPMRYPTDYVEFLRVYGACTIEGEVVIAQPDAIADLPLPSPTTERLTEQACADWAEFPGGGIARGQATAPVRAWGYDADGAQLCWATDAEEPDDWPVVVLSRGQLEWVRYDCGMVEYLLRVLRAEPAEQPQAARAIWGVAAPRVVGRQEELRRVAAGLDPLTGKPW
ncbi:SMI1/KNR4 family protein [Yinghuangia soli]|uniref:SMI1/KNR4 family protein n=1 Tax=Yinghuangia soli TaxID=2908204 RepID=A0AA41PZB7_9ACTN|nr:SMI1/KNR4 family protein [Yinghuangia soli]MCF2528694.1 SMI1/KNR4 family protein [Yinghuangia soli]